MKKNKTTTNIYDQYINYLIELEALGLDPSKGIEKHHIVPKHSSHSSCVYYSAFYPIFVYCSSQNHTLAHFYRFLAYGERGDWVAYVMRKDQKTNAFERSLMAVEKNKKAAILFWDPKWQSKQGKKSSILSKKKGTLILSGRVNRLKKAD